MRETRTQKVLENNVKVFTMRQSYVLTLLVLLAFGLMVFFSYSYVSDIERKHLINSVDNAFDNAKMKINADLQEPKTMLAGISGNIRTMILNKENDKLQDYFIRAVHLLENDDFLDGFDGLYGRIFDYGDFDGQGRSLPENYDMESRPWYTAALEANGKIAVTQPYVNLRSGNMVVTYSCLIFNKESEAIGIIALSMQLSRIGKYITESHLYKGSYGILTDEKFRVAAHPSPLYLGRELRDMNDGSSIERALRAGKEVVEFRTTDYLGNPAVLFVRNIKSEKIQNNWYLGILIPEKKYNENLSNMMKVLVTLGIIMSIMLSLILLRTIFAKIKTDELVQTILDVTPLGLSIWDKNFKNIGTNEETLRLLSLPSEKEYANRFFELSPEYQPDGKPSKEKVLEFFKQAFDEGYCRFEWMHQKLNGSQIPCEVTLIRIDYKGDFAVVSYTQDLREFKTVIAKIREADERTQLMLDSTPLGITFWDKNINLVDFNYEAARVLGIFNKQEYREKFQETVPEYQPDGKKSTEKLIEIINIAFKEGYSHTEWHHNTVHGETIAFDAMAVRLKYKGDDIVVVYCRDMREVNIAMEKMREADARAQILLNAAPISCTLFDENHQVIDCNNEALKLFKISCKKEYSKNFFKKYTPKTLPDGTSTIKRAVEVAKKALENGYCRFEWAHLDADGEEVPCEVTLVRVRYKGKDVLAGYVKDLREFRAMIKEMRKAEIAEASNKAKSKFLAAISHEIRTPMNAILGITEIQLQNEMLPASIKEAFNKIYNSGDMLLGIINDILDLSRIEMDRMEINPVKYEVASLINDTVHLNMMRNSKPVEFCLSVNENVPTLLLGDELRIKQILNNLLSNAYKYTDEGSVKLAVNVETENTEEGHVTLVFRVSDTGQGMTTEQMDRLFTTEYTRFNLEANRAIEGTGLGMSITYHLIKIMNGTISVESKPNEGTSFTVSLPQKTVNSEILGKDLIENLESFRISSSARMKKAQIIREYMPYGKVLIVDDVDSNLYVAKGLMAPYGLSIDVVPSGFEAIERIKTGNVYDVVFMDHMMPKMDGVETTKNIREMGYKEPIIALTANAIVGQAKFFLENGFDEFISKPIDMRQLNAVLNKFIRGKQSPEIIAEARKQKQNQEEAVFRSGISPSDPALHSVFLLDIKKALPVIEETFKNIDSISDEDLHLFTISVHSMKSSLANIGEAIASKLAFALEKAGKERNIKAIKMQTPVLIDDIRSIKTKIESEKKVASANADEDPGFLREQLRIICCASADYDERPVKLALDALKKLSWKEKTRSLIDKIDEQLLYGDFEEVRRLAAEQL
ncbi:MAG: response regulator [Fibromonadaceae bacterium]|jgi:signal transduction histidine kinase/CheY-like chemotaxis protein/HPt (histidine-containing phosphotransfer) domain-containing protein|nr:response regulator [Fibromonadaceae bacterium]